jgi:prolipoprotein diacylglyceryl transferase
VVARRAGADVALLADCLAPGLLLAQGIGRLGNYWNQELYGKPTDLPWGLEIAPENRPFSALDSATFHPTFLYELLWDLLAAGILVFVIERRFRPRPPGVFALYVSLYCFGRFWVELLRIDPAHELGPLRLNNWVAIAGFVGGLAAYVRSQRGRKPTSRPKPSVDGRGRRPRPGPRMAIPKGRVRPGR